MSKERTAVITVFPLKNAEEIAAAFLKKSNFWTRRLLEEIRNLAGNTKFKNAVAFIKKSNFWTRRLYEKIRNLAFDVRCHASLRIKLKSLQKIKLLDKSLYSHKNA